MRGRQRPERRRVEDRGRGARASLILRQPRVMKIVVAWVALACLLVLAAIKGPTVVRSLANELTERFSRRFGSMLRLEQVEWNEVGSSNMSRLVTRDVLWRASALRVGQEMLPLKLDELENKLLAIPWIESVQLQKKLPTTLVVRYTAHEARAIGFRKGKPWAVSGAGHWIAPLGKIQIDLPVITGAITEGEGLDVALKWFEAIEKDGKPWFGMIHEANVAGLKSRKMTILVDLKYQSRVARVSLVVMDPPREDALSRLKRVVQYVIKNNILVSAIDLRPGKKIVVNVGRSP